MIVHLKYKKFINHTSLLLTYNNKAKVLEDKADVNIIFFNIAKTFDDANHKLLLIKLKA